MANDRQALKEQGRQKRRQVRTTQTGVQGATSGMGTGLNTARNMRTYARDIEKSADNRRSIRDGVARNSLSLNRKNTKSIVDNSNRIKEAFKVRDDNVRMSNSRIMKKNHTGR